MVLPNADTEAQTFEYSTVEGCFLQDEPRVDGSTFDYTAVNFGLTYETDAEHDPNRERTQWERFDHYVSDLNRKNLVNVQYKLLYLVCNDRGLLMQYSR